MDGDAITMRAALRTSSNRAAVQMLQTIGVPAAVQYARQLGLGNMPQVASLALGSGEVTLLSLTSGFGAFANKGELAAPSLIRRVTSSEGEVLYESMVETTHAVSPTTAFLITSMLQDVINAGTAWQVRQMGFRLPAAGKTGTTSDYRDAWFVGYTPKLVTGVWVGYDKPRTIVAGGYAAQIAVPLWTRFMVTATKDDKAEWFGAPSECGRRGSRSRHRPSRDRGMPPSGPRRYRVFRERDRADRFVSSAHVRWNASAQYRTRCADHVRGVDRAVGGVRADASA